MKMLPSVLWVIQPVTVLFLNSTKKQEHHILRRETVLGTKIFIQ